MTDCNLNKGKDRSWHKINAEILSVKEEENRVIIEFRDFQGTDTAIFAFEKSGYKNEDGSHFVQEGTSVEFIKMPADIPKTCGLDKKCGIKNPPPRIKK